MVATGQGPAGRGRSPQGSLRAFRLIGLAFLILGIALGVLFAVLAVRASVVGDSRPTVEGTVVGNHEEYDRDIDDDPGDRHPTYYPVIDYVVDGKTYNLTSSTGSYPAKYSVGDKVTISYEPANPIDAEIAGSAFWVFVFLAIGFTVIMGGLGAILLIIGVRNLKREHRAEFERSAGGEGPGPAAPGGQESPSPATTTNPSGLSYPAYPVPGDSAPGPQRTSRKGIPIVVPIILITIGVVVTAIVAVIVVRGQQFEDRAIRASGVVTAMENDQGSFRPVVTYAVDGQERTFTASVASNPPAYEIGEKVTVLIDPVNRYDVKIEGQGTVVGMVFLGVGIAALLAGVIVLIVTLRRKSGRSVI